MSIKKSKRVEFRFDSGDMSEFSNSVDEVCEGVRIVVVDEESGEDRIVFVPRLKSLCRCEDYAE